MDLSLYVQITLHTVHVGWHRTGQEIILHLVPSNYHLISGEYSKIYVVSTYIEFISTDISVVFHFLFGHQKISWWTWKIIYMKCAIILLIKKKYIYIYIMLHFLRFSYCTSYSLGSAVCTHLRWSPVTSFKAVKVKQNSL